MSEDPIIPAANRINTIPPAENDTLPSGTATDTFAKVRERAGELIDKAGERAGELREKAGELLQSGVELAKERPYATAAVVGGVAATAAAAVYGGTRIAQARAAGKTGEDDPITDDVIDPLRVPDAIPLPIE